MHESHPLFKRLVYCYAEALTAWRKSYGVREAAKLFGLNERSYCDNYLIHFYSPLTYSSGSTEMLFSPEMFDIAYQQAERDAASADTPQPEVIPGLFTKMPGPLFEKLCRSFTTWDAAKDWLRSPSRYLGFRTPSDVLKSGHPEHVDAALEALAEGIFI
jgi:hypothetical protein